VILRSRVWAPGLISLIWLAVIALLWAWRGSEPQQLAVTIVVSYLLAWSLVFIVSRTGRSELSVRFLLMTASLGLVVATCEVAALIGLIDYRRVFQTASFQPLSHPANRLDSELLHITRGHTRVRLREQTPGDIVVTRCLGWTATSGAEYEIIYDRNGFRNTRDRDHVDIAVIGDSFLEVGKDSELLPAFLERLLQVPVANLGQSHYGPQQELAVLRRFAVPLRPKAVVWAFFEDNDLKDVHRYNRNRQKWAEILRAHQSCG
jgi:hypothetical protein